MFDIDKIRFKILFYPRITTKKEVVEMVSYIMGQGSEGFVFAAADLYPDGAINVMDLVNLVDLIMHPTASSNAREWTENGMSLSTMADGAVAVKVNNP